jgi:hypothetical protein
LLRDVGKGCATPLSVRRSRGRPHA